MMLTAYDYPSARLADRAGVDMVFVGRFAGRVVFWATRTWFPSRWKRSSHHVRACGAA